MLPYGRQEREWELELMAISRLRFEEPTEANMPGVVNLKGRNSALEKYPDPRIILGDHILIKGLRISALFFPPENKFKHVQ